MTPNPHIYTVECLYKGCSCIWMKSYTLGNSFSKIFSKNNHRFVFFFFENVIVFWLLFFSETKLPISDEPFKCFR